MQKFMKYKLFYEQNLSIIKAEPHTNVYLMLMLINITET